MAIVNTVDAFQGSERKIIILSMVRSNPEGDIGFNNDERRINVSFSRAQNVLIVILNSDTFLKSEDASLKIKKSIETLISIAQKEGTYHLVE